MNVVSVEIEIFLIVIQLSIILLLVISNGHLASCRCLHGGYMFLFKKTVRNFTDAAEHNDSKAIVEALGNAFLIARITTGGTIKSVSPRFCQLMGAAAEQIVGTQESRFMPSRHEGQEVVQATRRKESICGTFKRVSHDGKVFWLEGSYSPLLDTAGQVTDVVFSAVDITEKVLREHEARTIMAAVSLTTAIIEFDPHGNVLGANQRFLKLMGYSEQELKGKQHQMFCERELVDSAAYKTFWEGLRAGEFSRGLFKRLDRKGHVVWLEASYNPVYDMDGKLVKVVKFASDVTSRVLTAEKESSGAAQAYRICQQTEKLVESGSTILDETVREMQMISGSIEHSAQRVAQLGDRSEQITKIVNTIKNIADQTNLLALNAAIEAARAGEQGRGFAVVADEVRLLASRTAQSTTEIAQMIGLILQETRAAVDSINGSRDAAERGVGLANAAGAAMAGVREGTLSAVKAVSMVANKGDGGDQ